MTQNVYFVGLDVGKFDIFVFISSTGAAFSVANTASGYAVLRAKLGPSENQIHFYDSPFSSSGQSCCKIIGF